jgi:hypothetical protein
LPWVTRLLEHREPLASLPVTTSVVVLLLRLEKRAPTNEPGSKANAVKR